MATAAPASPPMWFWVVAALAINWNAFGVVMYLSSVGVFGDPTAPLSPDERAAAAAIPGWLSGAFAIGTFSGLIGSLALVLRQRWAPAVLAVSLIALLALEGWIVFFSGALEAYGLALPVAVSSGAIILVLVAFHARRRAWLR